MGFPQDFAAEALTATDGDIVKAAEWTLSDRHNHDHNHKGCQDSSNFTPICSASSESPPPFQPRIDRFFQFQSKPQTPTSLKPIVTTKVVTTTHEKEEQKEEEELLLLRLTKRSKVVESEQIKKQPQKRPPHEPFCERMRPRTLDDVVGQDHLLAPKSLLRSAIDCGRLPSILLWGPPGTGKTSVARAIVNTCSGSEASGNANSYRFISLSAITSGIKDVRDAVDEARRMKKRSNKRTILFIDEVRRFNKAHVIFMGATTENPSFHLITPLLSRSPHIATLLRRATDDSSKELSCCMGERMRIEVNDECIEFLSINYDGDARVALNALGISATTAAARMGRGRGSNGELGDDKGNADESSLSAVISLNDCASQSMRGSDANASIYWLARMLEGGEEPLYIARRLIGFASEDVGCSCYQACHFIGMPECNIILAQSIGAAQKVLRESVGRNEGVPLHPMSAPTKLMKDLGYGRDDIYPPDYPNSSQTYLPPSLQGF
ncbi:unnamed protein product [Withania somnifera]